MDEKALEAMLARQRASEQGHVEQPSVRTEQTDEFEVYERQVAEEAEAPQPPAEGSQPTPGSPEAAAPAPHAAPAPRAAPPPASAAPAPQPAARAPQPAPSPAPQPDAHEDFEELPGRDVPTEFQPPAAFQPEEPEAPPTAAPPAAPAEHAEPSQSPPAEPRRPQVWPPIRSREERDAQRPAEAPAAATADDAVAAMADAPVAAPASEPEEPGPPAGPATHPEPPNEAARSHAPTPHAFAPTGARGDGCRIALVQARFNQEITDMMAELAIGHATKAGAEVVQHAHVPGVYDLPLMVQHLARRDDVDAVVVIGCVVQGETSHDELITHATAKTLQEVALATEKPIGLGIIGPGMTWAQAEARVVNGKHAVEAVLAQWRALHPAVS